MQVALNVKQVQQDWSILLLDQTRDTAMIEHRAHPEAWHTEGTVLDFLHITRDGLQLLVVLIVEFLSAGLIGLDEFLLRGLGPSENLVTLNVDFLVELVVLELKCTVQSLLFLVKFALSILKIIVLVFEK